MAATLDEILELVTFARVVEATSFTRAAEKLGVSKSVVSSRLAGLEARLGMRLLHRTTRRLSLTTDGLELYPGCAQLAAVADEAQRSATRGSGPRGLLRFGAPASFPRDRLMACVASYIGRYPGVRVELVLSDKRFDLIGEEIDVSLRILVPGTPDSSLVVRRLATDRVVVVAAPDYLARRGTPTTPADLVHHDCMRYTLLKATEEWTFLGDDGWYSVPVSGPFSAQLGGALRDAAIAGIGIALMPGYVAAEDLIAGRLVRLLPDAGTRELHVCAVHTAGRSPPSKVRAFVEVLASELKLAQLPSPTGPRGPRKRPGRRARPG